MSRHILGLERAAPQIEVNQEFFGAEATHAKQTRQRGGLMCRRPTLYFLISNSRLFAPAPWRARSRAGGRGGPGRPRRAGRGRGRSPPAGR